jgi:hypothetical protein
MTTFRLATEADDALIRSILRDNGMSTWVEMAVEREPSFFAGENVFGRDWAVIAEEGSDVVGMYTAAVLPVHVNGRPEQLGYLGGLRVNPMHRRRIRHLREGYASIRPLARATGSLPWWFTVVAADNAAARRLLESGVRGLPSYYPLGEYVTVGLPTTRGRRRGMWRQAGEPDLQTVLEFHNARAARFQFSPVLHEAIARRIGLECFFIHEQAGTLRGVAALWNQRAFKQIVARRYRRPISALLPAYNAYAKLFRRIPLPREGQALEQTFIAYLGLADEALPHGVALLQDLLSRCPTPVAGLGLHTAHPLLASLDELKPMRYRAHVYAVSFETRPAVNQLPAQPEVALL